MKTFKTIFLTLAVIFLFTACYNTPTKGFKVEGSIENIQDYPSNVVMAFVTNYGHYNFGAKISESKLNNNYFSMFLPYELKDKYCAAVGTNKYILFDTRFESYITISNKNVKISDVWFNSNKEYGFGGNITQFDYREEFYANHVVDVTLVKTKYVYAQSAVSITGEYETRLTFVVGADYYKTVKANLFLQKGWNTVYYIGNYKSKPNTYFNEIDTAIVSITAEKPENIELKWYYCPFDDLDIVDFLKDNSDAKFMLMWFMDPYYTDFILMY